MNYAELGQKVKAKYPAYTDLSDDDLGRRVAAKYPEYQAQITQPGLLDQVAGVAKAVVPQTSKVVGEVAAYPETIKNLYALAQKDPQKASDQAMSLAKQYKGSTDKAKLELLPWLVPFGGSIAEVLGLGGVAGLSNALSKDKVTPEGVVTDTLTSAATAGVLKGTGAATSKVFDTVGKGIKNEGEQLVLRALKPSKSQLTKFKQETGQDLADFLNKNNISGDFAGEAQKRIDDLQGQFDALAIHSGAQVKTGKLQESFIKRIADMKGSVVPSVQAKAQDLQSILDNLIGKHGDSVDVGKLTEERRAIDALLKDGQFNLPIEQSSYLRSARDAIQEAVQDATKGLGSKDLKTIGHELRDLYSFQKIADSQDNLGRGTNVLGMLNMLGAGVGGTVAGLPGMAAGIAGSKIIQSPRAISSGSKAMQGAGEVLQKGARAGDRMEPFKRALRNLTTQQMSQTRLP